MKKIVTRFGEVEYDPEKLLYFPSGMIGLTDLRYFIVMPNKKAGPLFWIQSVDDPSFAFVLTDPTNFFLDYHVVPDDNDRRQLQIDGSAPCYTLSIVTVPRNQDITLNLAAPILFAPTTNRAIQVILENSPYSSKSPLPNPPVKAQAQA